MSCIVLESADREKIIALSDLHSECMARILRSGDTTFTPIPAKRPTTRLRPFCAVWTIITRCRWFCRNNRTSDEHPLGVFHPHADLHHIKKENIGLIEVMGLFILPGRLLGELKSLEDYLTGETPLDRIPDESSPLFKHYGWISAIAQQTGTHLNRAQAEAAIHKALGDKCARVLADAGVFKNNDSGNRGVIRFMESIGFKG